MSRRLSRKSRKDVAGQDHEVTGDGLTQAERKAFEKVGASWGGRRLNAGGARQGFREGTSGSVREGLAALPFVENSS